MGGPELGADLEKIFIVPPMILEKRILLKVLLGYLLNDPRREHCNFQHDYVPDMCNKCFQNCTFPHFSEYYGDTC